MKKAFSLLEIIFVISIIAIIASFALKNNLGLLEKANITKIQAQVALIRSGINSIKNQRLKLGLLTYPKTLDSALTNVSNELLFAGTQQEKLLDYPLIATTTSEKHIGAFAKISSTKYHVFLDKNNYVEFTYKAKEGTFTCNYEDELCKELD
ncbi:MAG: prepilin-type N-terminal cleavage/methylation domain-containing protein [Arcobacteraceae bacterium]